MTHLKAGDPAPDFSVADQNGDVVTLGQFAGKRLVLFFYPKDMTPGCTAEACDLRDNYVGLKKQGIEILGISADDAVRHGKFIAKYDLPFRLLADVDRTMIEAYGVWGPKKFMGREFDGIHRTTFIVGANGLIEAVIPKVRTKDHAAQIAEVLEAF